MNGFGYTPICSSSCRSKTHGFEFYGITALIFREPF